MTDFAGRSAQSIATIVPAIKPVNTDMDAQLQQIIDQKTKPLGALGRLETLAWQIARVQQSFAPQLSKPHILVFAADHGVAMHGVSAFPQEVTWQMVLNFLQGGAAINVLCKAHAIGLSVVDVGVNYDFADIQPASDGTTWVQAKIRYGTADMRQYPAMSAAECGQAIVVGRQQVAELAANGCNVLGFGDMGIANTSAAALLMSRLLHLPLAQCVGRGTGLDDRQLQNKLLLLAEVSARHGGERSPLEVLAAMGGLEIAAIVGGMLEAAHQQRLILVDGFIATAAYLVAFRLQPAIAAYAVFCHCSQESGHQLMLSRLQAEPLLDLGMRLGEGSGCAVALPLLQSALAILNDMASFSTARVSEG